MISTYDAVLFDLLTALLDSWTLWNNVAGAAYDMFGTSPIGLPTYWHDRIGMTPPPGAPLPAFHERSLAALLSL